MRGLPRGYASHPVLYFFGPAVGVGVGVGVGVEVDVGGGVGVGVEVATGVDNLEDVVVNMVNRLCAVGAGLESQHALAPVARRAHERSRALCTAG